MYNQFTLGLKRRVMYVENKATGEAHIGWVSFSRTGRTVYDGTRTLRRDNGIAGNFIDQDTGEEFWVSAPKARGSNAHPYEPIGAITVDEDAREEWQRIRS